MGYKGPSVSYQSREVNISQKTSKLCIIYVWIIAAREANLRDTYINRETMKMLAVFALATLCLFSVMNEARAAENEWLPYFMMMSGSSAPVTLSPAILLGIGLGAVLLTQMLGSGGSRSQMS